MYAELASGERGWWKKQGGREGERRVAWVSVGMSFCCFIWSHARQGHRDRGEEQGQRNDFKSLTLILILSALHE